MPTKTPREIEDKLEEIKYNFLNYNGVHTKEYMYDFLVTKPTLALLEEARQEGEARGVQKGREEMKEKCLKCVPLNGGNIGTKIRNSIQSL